MKTRKSVKDESIKKLEKSNIENNTIKPKNKKKKHLNIESSESITDLNVKTQKNEIDSNGFDDNLILKQAKVCFSTTDNVFLLYCVICNCKSLDVPEFVNHNCKKETKQKQRITKESKTPEESIGTESNLVIGQDGLWHCRICDKGYEKKNSLKKHEQAHLLTYTCEICGKGLKSPVNLREHMNIHSGARPYKCHLCPMAFARKWGLTSHVRSHIGDKRYGCQYCGKKFINGAILKIHVRMVHTKEKPCQCELCGQHFYSNQLLKEHKKRHMNIRPYKCEYENCGKSFYDRKQLNRHYVSHSDEKPFECTYNNCTAKFARHKTLQAHLKIHSGVKDHICSICGKAFAMNYNLTSHLKSHANGKINGRKDQSSEKRQYNKKKKERNLNQMKNELRTIEIKNEPESVHQNEFNQFPIKNEEQLIPADKGTDSNMNVQLSTLLASTTDSQVQDKIEFNDNKQNILEQPDEKSLILIYDNARNLVPSTTSTINPINGKFDVTSPSETNNDTIPILTLPQTVVVNGTDETVGEMGAISNSISQIVTMDQLAFHIYQIPNS